MIRLYDPDPDTEPSLLPVSGLRIVQYSESDMPGAGAGPEAIPERETDDRKTDRPPAELGSEITGIVIRRNSRVRNRIGWFFQRGVRILAEPGLAEEGDPGWRFLSGQREGIDRAAPAPAGVYLLHPYAFHPLFLSLFSLIGEGAAGEIESCRMSGLVPDRPGLAALLDMASLLGIGDPDPSWLDVGLASGRQELRGTIRGSGGRLDFSLSESSSLELVTADGIRRMPLPEGDGTRCALLDFLTRAPENLESTIYPLRLGIPLRRRSAGLLPLFFAG